MVSKTSVLVWSGWLGEKEKSNLVPNNQGLPVRSPGECECLSEPLDFVEAVLGPNVPELDDAIVANGAKLGVLDGIECNPLDWRRVALELSGETDIVLLWVPCMIDS